MVGGTWLCDNCCWGRGRNLRVIYTKTKVRSPVWDTYRTRYLTLLFHTSFPEQAVPSNSTSSLSANQFRMSHTILPNTSIAATSCIPGDRWVFLQDVTGAIRGAQYSVSNSTWNTQPQQFNFAPTKVGTALSASCVDLADVSSLEAALSPGLYVRSPRRDFL